MSMQSTQYPKQSNCRRVAGSVIVAVAWFLAAAPTLFADELALAPHWTLAVQYTNEILPENNHYDSPCDVYYDEDVLYAYSKCGSYVAEVHRNAYPTLRYSVMKALFNSGFPTAARWYDGIAEERTYTNSSGTFGATLVSDFATVKGGDILVAKYSSGGASGHAMMADSFVSQGVQQIADIPGYTHAERFLVDILDCTRTPHGVTDSRKGAELDNSDDRGIGRGQIYVFADQDTGEIVGWTWSANLWTIYQCTDSNAANYRPLVAGYVYGPGI